MYPHTFGLGSFKMIFRFFYSICWDLLYVFLWIYVWDNCFCALILHDDMLGKIIRCWFSLENDQWFDLIWCPASLSVSLVSIVTWSIDRYFFFDSRYRTLYNVINIVITKWEIPKTLTCVFLKDVINFLMFCENLKTHENEF